MAISMYQAAIPPCLQILTALSAILDKAATHLKETGGQESELIEARLAPDMLPFARQVQMSTDHAKFIAARLSGREPPRYEDTETTIEELKARIAKALAFVSSVEVAEVDGSEERAITLRIGGNEMHFTGQRYLVHFALPNFYFHATTAYDLLRHKGVQIGKRDFMGAN